MKKILHNILEVLDKKEKKQFSILLLFDVVMSILDIGFLALLLWIIRFYIQPEATGYSSLLPAWLINRNHVLFIAIFVLLFCIKNWLGYLVSRNHFNFLNRVAVRISRNTLHQYQDAAYSEFVHTDSSVHIRNICYSPFEFTQHMLSGFQQIVTQLALILIAITAILIFNAKIFLLLLLILLPPAALVSWLIKKRIGIAKQHIQLNNEQSFRHVLDALKGYVESNIYNRRDFFLNRFIASRKKFSTALFNSLALQNLPARVIEVFAVIGLFMLIVIASWTGNKDKDMLISIGAFMAAAYKIIPGMVRIINVSGQLKAYAFSLQDLEHNKKPGAAPPGKNAAELLYSMELKNISFCYKEKTVLERFSMSVKGSDFIGITGESGKGKTTLLNLLLGFLTPACGNILVNEIPVNSSDIKKYWTSIAYVRQQSFFIHDTLLRNITLQESGYDQAQLDFALRISGVDKMMAHFPEGLEKVISENGKNISGGQQQRIAIARALYKNAGLILLDEPFNELDETSTHTLLAHLRELAAGGKAIVMITHDSNSLSYCNKIISLDEQ